MKKPLIFVALSLVVAFFAVFILKPKHGPEIIHKDIKLVDSAFCFDGVIAVVNSVNQVTSDLAKGKWEHSGLIDINGCIEFWMFDAASGNLIGIENSLPAEAALLRVVSMSEGTGVRRLIYYTVGANLICKELGSKEELFQFSVSAGNCAIDSMGNVYIVDSGELKMFALMDGRRLNARHLALWKGVEKVALKSINGGVLLYAYGSGVSRWRYYNSGVELFACGPKVFFDIKDIVLKNGNAFILWKGERGGYILQAQEGEKPIELRGDRDEVFLQNDLKVVVISEWPLDRIPESINVKYTDVSGVPLGDVEIKLVK